MRRAHLMLSRALHQVKRLFPDRFLDVLRPCYHFILALVAAVWYRFPSRRLIVVGVTGTKGKTTVVELIHKILQGAGHKTASLSSISFRVGDEVMPNDLKMTMPGRFFIQRFLRDAVRTQCRYAVLEVTSEGIKQFRHRFISFRAGVMTNVAPEHIESHGTLEQYLRAKLDLFWRIVPMGVAIINRDDGSAPRFSAATAASKVFYGVKGISSGKEDFPFTHVSISGDGIAFEFGRCDFHSPLLGEFNFYNIIAAVAFGVSSHIPCEKIAQAVGGVLQIPGRMEFVQEKPFGVMIDYAHTPESLRSTYRTLQQLGRFSRFICVLGAAGGGRDRWKRPELGRVASDFCDEIVLTEEDSYDETTADILTHIRAGVGRHKLAATREISDRREALRAALTAAHAGDVVIATGKGAETWLMGPHASRNHWSERGVLEEELRVLQKN